MNVYRVMYMYRASPEAPPQEKVAFVVAKTDIEAVAHVNSIKGNDVQGANPHVQNVMVAAPAPEPAPAASEKT